MMAAHLFCLYFGVLADVTPPVALATYAASGISKSNPMKTGFTALVVAVAGFLVPYMFVYNPYLLFQGNIFQIAFGFGAAFLAIVGLASGVQGYFLTHINILERLALLALPFLIIVPSMMANGLAVALMAGVVLFQKAKIAKLKAEPAS